MVARALLMNSKSHAVAIQTRQMEWRQLLRDAVTDVCEKGRDRMQNLLSLLPVLICPISMGLLMWLMMRMGKEQTPIGAGGKPEERQQAVVPGGVPQISMSLSSPSPLRAIWNCVQMCLNWKVLVGLVFVAVLIGAVAPNFFWSAIPLLLVLACPLSMMVMLVSTNRTRENARNGTASCLGCPPPGVEPPQMFERSERKRSAEVKW